MSQTQIEENNNEENSNESFVLDSGASAHYYPTAFDKESPNDGNSQGNKIILANANAVHSRSQGNSEIVIAESKKEFKR